MIKLYLYYTAFPKEPVKDCGIMPHHVVQPTVQDALTGKDRDMTYALKLIKETIASQANSR